MTLAASNFPFHWKPVHDRRGRKEPEGLAAFSLHPHRPPLRLYIDDTENTLSPEMDCLLKHSESPLVEVLRVREFRRSKGPKGWGIVRGSWPMGERPSDDYVCWGHMNLVWKTRFSYLRNGLSAEEVSRIKQKIGAHEYAGGEHFDAFVTECPAFAAYRKLGQGTFGPTILTPREALCLVGVHRRINDEFAYRYPASSTFTFGRLGHGHFAVQVLLPELTSLGGREDPIRHRLGRALFARDRIQRCFLHFPTRREELQEEALFYLDSLLVSLVGAFDLWARAATEMLQLEIEGKALGPRDVNWRKPWRKALTGSAPELAALLKGKVGKVIDACTGLRNWIHGPPLSAALLLHEFDDAEPGLAITDSQTRRDIEAVVDAYGGEWGVMLRDTRCLMLNVPVFSERLLVVALGAVAALVRFLVPGPALPPDFHDDFEVGPIQYWRFMPDLRRICGWLVGISPETP